MNRWPCLHPGGPRSDQPIVTPHFHPEWKALGVSVAGLRHSRKSEPCQDAVRWSVLRDGTLAVVMADGAGSASLAELGAQCACEAAMAWLEAHFRGDTLENLADFEIAANQLLLATRDAVRSAAEGKGATPRDLACTFLCALAKGDRVAAVQVGDGAIVVLGPEGKLSAVTLPPSGEYLNETVFLVVEEVEKRSQKALLELEVKGMAAFTDGLQLLALNMGERAPHPPFFSPLFKFLSAEQDPAAGGAKLAGFLRSPKLQEKTDDDLTLFLALRGQGG